MIFFFFNEEGQRDKPYPLTKHIAYRFEGTSGRDVIWLLDGRWKPDEESDL